MQQEIAEIKVEKDSLKISHSTLLVEFDEIRLKQMQLTSLPGAPFYDIATQTSIICPVLQSNGLIVPLKTVLSQWFNSVAADDGYIHRTYVCPVMQTPTTLASIVTQERIRHIAQHAGIDTRMPLVFSYRTESGQTTEFDFQDQLNITARICAIQTMLINDCVERIVVHKNTMALEIVATVNEVIQSS
jgi:hypothetical protein